jgi:hypothetical protein
MEKLNCTLAYAVYRLHSGDASARRHVSAIRSNSIAFVFVIGHWSLLLHWKCVGSKRLVRGNCPHSFESPGGVNRRGNLCYTGKNFNRSQKARKPQWTI